MLHVLHCRGLDVSQLVQDASEVAGRGITGSVDGWQVAVGSARLMAELLALGEADPCLQAARVGGRRQCGIRVPLLLLMGLSNLLSAVRRC